MQLPNDLKSTKSLHHIVIVEDWNNILSKQWHSLVYSIGWIDAIFFYFFWTCRILPKDPGEMGDVSF